MSNFDNLKKLYDAGKEILLKESEILETEGYDIVDIKKRISNIKSFLEYASLNEKTIVSIMQMDKAIGFPETVERAKLRRDAESEQRLETTLNGFLHK